MDYAADAGKGAVYVLDTDFTVRKVIAQVSCSNGIVWTKDQKTMYYIDTPTQQVHRYDYHIATGAITNKQVAVQISREVGLPDGMAIDMEDRLWIAMCGTGSVCCWDTITGRLIDTIEVPGAKLTTSCAFGGPDLSELYITSANVGLSADEVREQPNAGALFKIELDVQGSPTYEFNG
jgi:sugar lactone lactonase YvrE